MPLATAPPAAPTVLAQLRSRAWIVPCLLIALVVGSSIASARRGSAMAGLELPRSVADKPHASSAAVRCELRHGFVLRLAITTQIMARAFLPGAQQGDHTPGATCQIQAP